VITSAQVMPLILDACPGLCETWDRYVRDRHGKERGPYIDMAQVAGYLVQALSQENTQEFSSLFNLVERLLAEGDAETQQVISVGLLEDIQNVASHEPFGARVFERWLGPLARKAWAAGQQSWEGKPSLAAVLRAESGQPPRPELVPDISKIKNPELAALVRRMYRTPDTARKKAWWRFW
jgi:hypothetical protein